MLKIFNVRTFNFSSDAFVSCFSKGLDKVPSFTLSSSFKVLSFPSSLSSFLQVLSLAFL